MNPAHFEFSLKPFRIMWGKFGENGIWASRNRRKSFRNEDDSYYLSTWKLRIRIMKWRANHG